MKIQFESNLEYQDKAINSVVNIFEGQEICHSNFSVKRTYDDLSLPAMGNDLGIGNRLELLEDELLSNVQNIQLHNGLPQSDKLNSLDFSVEMETGTGKTYVYLKSIFELNKKYGFTKFIIVVPSIAIKEGANKSLDITKEHFEGIFDNINYDYFIYDSSNLEQVRDFATSSDIRIMIINIDAFKKSFADKTKDTKANIIHRLNDKLDGQRPIDFIASTNPILIIDEPQSVDNTDKAKEAIKTLNPLCKLRYSATHIDPHNLVYKLDSIDAYEQKLVKQIEVANVGLNEQSNLSYIKLISVKANPRSAKVEMDINEKGRTKRKVVTITGTTDLYEKSNGRDVYNGYTVNDIYIEKDNEYVEFGNGEFIKKGETKGDVDHDTIKRLQISKTIEEHLNKELKLNDRGIKVLSLFFIDRVHNYRDYDSDGNPINGKFAIWFEEEYLKIIKKPKYNTLFKDIDVNIEASKIHNGYFSSDKKGKLKDTTGNNKDDEDTFSLIMKDKEKLLSFESPLKFIFSHSALKEGWDNPNVFQICTLNEANSVIRKRQQIGRGLRICVNQKGERIQGFYANTLTVMANESYEDFARELQREIEEEEGIKFGVIESHFFANITVEKEDGNVEYLGAENSEIIFNYLKENEYLNTAGKIQDNLKNDIKENKFEVPTQFENSHSDIVKAITKVAGKLNIKKAEEKENVNLNKEILLGDDFKILWDNIKHKTTYRVDFDHEKLIEECASKIKDEITIGKIHYVYSKATNQIVRSGVQINPNSIVNSSLGIEIIDFKLPDIITYLQNETNLKRSDIVNILIKSGKLEDFKNNPQKFIDSVIEIIKKTMSIFIVDGISYQRLGDEFYYAQECFDENELSGYLSSNMFKNRDNKSIYDYTIYDSDIERSFAKRFNENENVKLFTKLPSWFKIPTPLGTYNPDWAVLIERDDEDKLYFVVESKGSLWSDDIRKSEESKIKCGKKHFAEISEDINFVKSDKFDNFTEHF